MHRLASRNAFVACPHQPRAAGPRRVPDLRGLRRRRRARPRRGSSGRCPGLSKAERFEPHLQVLEISGRARIAAQPASAGGRRVTALSLPARHDGRAGAAPARPSPVRVGAVDGRRRRADRRPVDDQHRHGRRRRDGRAGRGARPRRLGDRAHHRRSRRGRGGGAAYPRAARPGAASTVPLVGDFHYIGHKLLADHPACAEALDKYRINPGNVGFKDKKDRQFAAIVELAIRHGKAVRIGANWGSLDQELLTRLMDENARRAAPARRPRRHARGDGAVGAALGRARRGDRPCPRPHHPVGQGLGRAGPDRRLPRARARAPTMRSISA